MRDKELFRSSGCKETQNYGEAGSGQGMNTPNSDSFHPLIQAKSMAAGV